MILYHRFNHIVVNTQNAFFSAEAGVAAFVSFSHDGELVENVGDGGARSWKMPLEFEKLIGCFVFGLDPIAVQIRGEIAMEERDVEFTPELKAALIVPHKRGAIVAQIASPVLKVMSSIG